ncbi:efflux RND transporter periplasmic adaptor subunit [Schlesneria paludicola]|uniref:efflux RND transporter periplasmic adaptor subunit n=1 Tax=Schlesneria paludicola TaxID=360056 RepID=UPI00029A135E|nr:efflux RND transporter periplasmic adaptor subunit [Schlesneria paludicola]
MRTAVLERTRRFFGLADGSSFTALRNAVRPFIRSTRPTTKSAVVNQVDRPGPKSPRKNRFLLMSAILAPAALGVAFEPWKSTEATSVAAEHGAIATDRTVTVSRPTREATATVVLPASFRPWQVASLHARVSGYLAAWHKDLGDSVSAGELLAEIDTPELDQELMTARALVREAVAAVTQARAERVEAEADLKVAEAQVTRARSEVNLAKSQHVRRGELVAKNVISREEFETFTTQVETRTAEINAAESDVTRRRTNLETRTAIIEAREATVNSRQANVNRLEELQAFKRIVAPFDGVVTRRTAEVGMLMTAGQGSVFVIEDLNRIRVQLAVPQAFASLTHVGTVAGIRIPESLGSVVTAEVTRIADSVDSSSRTMLAEIELDNRDRRFQSGIYAQVTLNASQGNESWTVPTNVLAMRIDGPHVAVISDSNRIEMRRVRLGRDLGTRIVVTEGIKGHERLVVNPSDDLSDGLQIQVAAPKTEQILTQR